MAEPLIAPRDFPRIAEEYADGAANGKFPVAAHIGAAYRKWFRYADAYHFDGDRLTEICHLIEYLSLPEGVRGSKFQLQPWQVALLSWVYAFRRDGAPDAPRAIRELNLVIPRKAGKSSLAAAMMLAELVSPTGDIDGPEVLISGVNKDTAYIAFKKVRFILSKDKRNNDSRFINEFEIRWNRNAAECGLNDGTIEQLSAGSRSLEGKMAAMVFVDEISRLPDEEPIETLRSGLGHNENALIFTATTPGELPASALEPTREQTLRWLKEEDDLGRRAGLCYEAGVREKFDDRKVWVAVQPSMGINVFESHYEEQAKGARATERALYAFETRLLCKPLSGGSVWVSERDLEDLELCSGPPPAGRDWQHWIGVDLSDVSDTTSLCLLSVNEKAGEQQARWRIFYPSGDVIEIDEDTDEERTIHAQAVHREYQLANKRGEVMLCAGRAINMQMVADSLRDWLENVDPRPFGLVADNYDALLEVRKLLGQKYERLWLKQGKSAEFQSEPAGVLESWIKHKTIKFEHNSVVRQHFKNTRVTETEKGGLLLTKPHKESAYKIDAVDALINAAGGYRSSLGPDTIGKHINPYRSTGEYQKGQAKRWRVN